MSMSLAELPLGARSIVDEILIELENLGTAWTLRCGLGRADWILKRMFALSLRL